MSSRKQTAAGDCRGRCRRPTERRLATASVVEVENVRAGYGRNRRIPDFRTCCSASICSTNVPTTDEYRMALSAIRNCRLHRRRRTTTRSRSSSICSIPLRSASCCSRSSLSLIMTDRDVATDRLSQCDFASLPYRSPSVRTRRSDPRWRRTSAGVGPLPFVPPAPRSPVSEHPAPAKYEFSDNLSIIKLHLMSSGVRIRARFEQKFHHIHVTTP